MKIKLVVPVVTVLVALLVVAGCTGGGSQTTPSQTAAPTQVPTLAVSTTVFPTAAGSSTQPGPTQTLPAATPVSFSVEKAGTYSTTIITTFDGGKGMSGVSKVDVRVTRADGTVVTGVLKPLKGETVELEGTKGTDRVEVIVTMNTGSVYKVIDQQMPYKTRG
ncbi:MAG: hypothetical protein OS112_08110 [Methanoregula sp.]|nr:MAG: hypothetical protein OS112_08110 [Methanoregula sp.]